MCSVVLGAALAAVSTVGQMVSGYYGGQVNKRLLRDEAKLSDQTAGDLKKQGAAATRAQRIKTAQMVGAQRAAYAGSGVDVNQGSALMTQLDTATGGEMDALLIRDNADKQVWAQRYQSSLLRAKGRAAEKAGYLGASISFAGGTSNFADKYYQMGETARQRRNQGILNYSRQYNQKFTTTGSGSTRKNPFYTGQ